MDRLNSSYYSLEELPDILKHYFNINITLKELIKCAEKVALITSFKVKGNSSALMFGNEKVDILSIPSHVRYKESILKAGHLGTLKLEDEYRMISFKVEGRNTCNVKDVDEIKSEYSNVNKDPYISLSYANVDFTDFFVIPRTCYLNNSFNQSELKLSVKDFKNYPLESSEGKDIDIVLWLKECDENNISILLPYSDIYVTRSHLSDFCQSYKQIAHKINEEKEYYHNLIVKEGKQQKEIEHLKELVASYSDKTIELQKLKETVENDSQIINQLRNGNSIQDIDDLSKYFKTENNEYPTDYLKMILRIYKEVWCYYFINREEKQLSPPTAKTIKDKIHEFEPNNNWTNKEIEMLERASCPIVRDQNKIKEIKEKLIN